MRHLSKKNPDNSVEPDLDVIREELESHGLTADKTADLFFLRLVYYEELDRQGRLFIKPPPITGTCGTCGHFVREYGKSSGVCAVRKHRNCHGKVIGEILHVTQARKACRDDYCPTEE